MLTNGDQWGSSLRKTQLKNQWSIENDGDLGHIKHRVRHPALGNETGGGQTCWATVTVATMFSQVAGENRVNGPNGQGFRQETQRG